MTQVCPACTADDAQPDGERERFCPHERAAIVLASAVVAIILIRPLL